MEAAGVTYGPLRPGVDTGSRQTRASRAERREMRRLYKKGTILEICLTPSDATAQASGSSTQKRDAHTAAGR